MKLPTRAISGNLRWMRDGTVWADWVLTGVPYGMRPRAEKDAARLCHQMLFRSLPGESLFVSVCAQTDIESIVTSMIKECDPASAPEWVAEVEATIDVLDTLQPAERVYYLSVPLDTPNSWSAARSAARLAWNALSDILGIPHTHIPASERSRRAQQAQRIAETIPMMFSPQPATAAHMVWMHHRQLTRGLYLDEYLPHPSENAKHDAFHSGMELEVPIVDERGLSDLPAYALRRLNPGARRFVKITSAHGLEDAPASYQSLSVVAGTPESFVFPGGEILGRIDRSGLYVDWSMRLSVQATDKALRANRRAMTRLTEQFKQREGESSFTEDALGRIAEALGEYNKELAVDEHEVEIKAVITVAVASDDVENLRAQTRILHEFFKNSGYKISQPMGLQSDLWWSMQPGVALKRSLKEFEQLTTSKHLSAIMPIASAAVGDSKGSFLGVSISAGPLLPGNVSPGPANLVFLDLDGASDRHRGGSLALFGEPGGGKTATMMKLAGDIADRGGQIIVADRTEKQEWRTFAEAITDCTVVDAVNPEYSLDPLRLFGREKASQMMQSFVIPLLSITPQEPAGVLLAKLLRPAYLDTHNITSSASLARHLEDLSHDASPLGTLSSDSQVALERLAGSFTAFAEMPLGAAVFSDNLPVVSTAAPSIVILTHGLAMPKTAQLLNEHLFKTMTLQQIFGRAFHALLAEFAKELCFRDSSVPACLCVPEAHAFMSSFEGSQVIEEFLRDGRKHRAVLLIDSHDPESDFHDETVRDLMKNRLAMRQEDKNLAARTLKWMDLDPTDPELLNLLMKDTSPDTGTGIPEERRGEGILRVNGSVDRIKVFLPARAHRAEAITRGGSAQRRRTLSQSTAAPQSVGAPS